MTSPVLRLSRRRVLIPTAIAAAAAVAVATWIIGPARDAGAAVPPPPAGMSLVFSDDFNGTAGTGLNKSNWLYDLGHGYPGGAANWGTGEIETATDSTANVFQDGQGHLAIKPIRDNAGNWTSGRVETQRTDFAAPAGGKLRIEGSLQQPNVSGAQAAAYWPAFWTLGAAARPVGATNWPGVGEWDVMEDINGRSSQFATLHCGVAPGGPCNEFTGLGSGEKACAGCQTAFHTYAVEYDRSTSPEQLRWFLDGTLIHSVKSDQMDAASWNNATHHGMFVILNVAIGGSFPGAFGAGLPTDATKSGVPMLVDYVAVYQSGAGNPPPAPNPQPTVKPSPKPTSAPPTSAPPTAGPPPPPPGGNGPTASSVIEAEKFSGQGGIISETTTDSGGGRNVGAISNGDWLQYNNVDFGSTPLRTLKARVASGAGPGVSGLVEVRLDSRSNAPVSTFAIANTGGWQSWRTVPASMGAVTGKHTVFLTFASGQPTAFVNLNRFTFRND